MQEEVPVIIAGGGPIGLALAAYLGELGVRTLLVERGSDRVGSAKMIIVSMRTMEFCRQLGIADEVRDWGFPLDHGLDSVFATSLRGFELGRVKTPPLRVVYDTPFTPERERPCPQTWFDPILQKLARRQPSVELRYHSELVAFRQDETGVDCALLDKTTGATSTMRARYLVGCDGYSSMVRKALGVEVRGMKHLDLSMSVYLTIPALLGQHRIGDAYRYVFVGETGVWCVLTTIDGHDFYRLQLIGAHDVDVKAQDIDKVMKQILPEGATYEITEYSSWVRKATVADTFRDGRVFLAGDAAHAHPPNGGLGMNTGIIDSWNLGWKLAAVLQGWGGETLLDSYDAERRPAAARATAESLKNYHSLVGTPSYAGLGEDTPAAAELRAQVGRKLVEQNERVWNPVGIHLGTIYAPSPVIVADDDALADDGPSSPGSRAGALAAVQTPSAAGTDADATTAPGAGDAAGDYDYSPTSTPGARAPHVWLNDGRSMLDEFGQWFTLLAFSGADCTSIEAAARERKVPFKVVRIESAEAARLYERGLVMVRPDGHVAWRADSAPAAAEAGALIDRVRGAGPAIASFGSSQASMKAFR